MRLMCWPDGERYLHPSQFIVVSLLLSLISTLLFSWTGGILSRQSSLTCRFSRFSPRNLCSLAMLAVFSLIYAATNTALCEVLVSLELAESRIRPAAPVDTCPRTYLILHCPATNSLHCSFFGNFLSLYDLWSRPWGVAWLLGLHGLPPCLHPSEGVGQPTTTTRWFA